MKKFRNLFMVLALALVLVFAAKGLGANAETVVDPVTFSTSGGSGSSISGTPTFNVNDASVTVAVNGTDQLYYQVAKDATEANLKKLKAAGWLPAVKVGVDYKVDLSAYSKDVTVVFTFDPTVEGEACKTLKTFTVAFPKTTKVKAKALFTTTVSVDPNDPAFSSTSGVVTLDKIVDFTGTTGADGFKYQWRKSANVAWEEDPTAADNDDDLLAVYRMLRASNGTLYVRAYKDGFASKEVKVKIPKGAAAPKVKVDYVKGEIAFPKTVQVVYSASGATTRTLGTPDATNGFSTTTTATSAKISVPVDKIVTAVGAEAGADVSFQVRTAATDKKYGSYFTTIAFKAPAAAPTVTGVYDATKKVVTLAVSGSTTDVKLQYFTDKNKWADVKNNEIKAATKPTTAIKVRVAPVKETKTDAGKFGSKECSVTVAGVQVKVKLGAAVTNGTVKIGDKAVTEAGIDVEKGSNVDITIAPAENYKLKSVKVGTEDKTSAVSAGGKLTISAIAADTTITVEFEAASN